MAAAVIVCPDASPLMISTMTVMTKAVERLLDGTDTELLIDLETFSRFIPVYESSHDIIQAKTGGAVGLRHSSIMPRGSVINKKAKEEVNYKKAPFDNQTTIFYEYWGCRYVNIMLFTNTKLKIAGAISEHEANIVTNIIIELLKNTKIRIYASLQELEDLKISEHYQYAIVREKDTDVYEYYIYNYFEFFKNQELFKELENSEILWLNKTGWISGTDISAFITFIKAQNSHIEKQFLEIKEAFNKIIANDKKIQLNDDDIKQRDELNIIKNNLQTRFNTLNMAIAWMEELRDVDNYVMDKYKHPTMREFNFIDPAKTVVFSSLNTELINSDFNANFVINNTKLQKILNTRYHIFPSYEPNDYPGLKIKFFWHDEQTPEQRLVGKCPHKISCITKRKKHVCIAITISVFQSGRTIITAGKTIEQIECAYAFITKVFKDNYEAMCRGVARNNVEVFNKLYDNPSNEIRKMMKKKKLYYIKKTNIINLPHLQPMNVD